jgi:GxxExxY protein
MTTTHKYSEETGKVIKAFYKVYNILGHGFLEKVYERSIVIELRRRKLFYQEFKIISTCI